MSLDIPIVVGARFGRYVLVERRPNDSRHQARWLCRCDCGVEKIIRLAHLRHGKSNSCGCDRKPTRLTHGQSGKGIPEYRIWMAMNERCSNPHNKRYADWGGRGIRVCDRWRHDYTAFLADMGPRPSDDHQIDRINNDGNYEPGNCRWATRVEQRANRRDSKGR